MAARSLAQGALPYRLVVLPSLFTAGLCLAAPPLQWLVNTWVDPAYGSLGGYVWVLILALFCWSATSPRRSDAAPLGTTEARRSGSAARAIPVLCLAAVVRLGGWALHLRGTGVVALAVVMYAAGVAAALRERRRPVSPLWLAAAFLFTLPVGRLAERLAGYGLERLAAASACGAMDLALPDVVCIGSRVVVSGKDVLADLPGAGARLLLALALFLTLAAAAKGPRLRCAVSGALLALAGALGADAWRLAVLAMAEARPGWLVGLAAVKGPADVVAAAFGLAPTGWQGVAFVGALLAGALPILAWHLMTRGFNREHRRERERERERARDRERERERAHALVRRVLRPYSPAASALFAVLSAYTLTTTPPQRAPLANHEPILPAALAGYEGVPLPLGAKEYACAIGPGGGAAKASYGDQVLRLIATVAPLRSLRAPDECLPESGHSVAFVGFDYGRLPAAIFHDVAPDGRLYRLAVTYVSDDGRMATSVAEVVGHWLWDGGGRWTAVERTSYWDEDPEARERLDTALAQSLGLPDRGTASLAAWP